MVTRWRILARSLEEATIIEAMIHRQIVTASEDADMLSLTARKQKVMAMGQMLASTSKSRTALLVADTQKGEREVCRVETITMMRSFP